MARKISAKTLAGLLGAYRARFPEEFAEKAVRGEPAEASELLALLAPSDAWALLRSIGPDAGREWLNACQADTLRRLIRKAAPGRPEPEADATKGALEAVAVELLAPADAAD